MACDPTSAERQRRVREREALNLAFMQGDMPWSLVVFLTERGHLPEGKSSDARARGAALIQYAITAMNSNGVTKNHNL